MDPYLEGSLWMSVHTQLCAEIARQLAPRLRPKYLALTTERFVTILPESVAVSTRSIYPDVGVLESERGGKVGGGPAISTAPLRLATVMPERVPHVTVEIRDVAERRLVSSIEVLSPVNKRGEGREEYLAKRRRLLLSTAHLMEIDLLREGIRVPMQDPLPPFPYFVFLSRAEDRPFTQVWPVPLDGRLPTVPVPLLPGDPDVPLDVQQGFTNVYDGLGYDLAVDYSKPPQAPLVERDAAWADDLLRRQGKRG